MVPYIFIILKYLRITGMCKLICQKSTHLLDAQKAILSRSFPVFIVLGIYNVVAPLLWAQKRLRCFSPFSLLPTSLLFF